MLAVLGAGGHAREILRIIERLRDSGDGLAVACVYADPGTTSPEAWSLVTSRGHRTTEDSAVLAAATHFVAAVGDSTARRLLADLAVARGLVPLAVASPESLCDSPLSPGDVVFPHSVVSCDVALGAHVHVNTGCSVSHDVTIGDWTTLSPGVRLAGGAHVGSSVFLGTGAVVLPRVRIGDGATVGAGAVVTQDVPAGTTVAGVPARPL